MTDNYRQRHIKWKNEIKIIAKEIWAVSIFQKTKNTKRWKLSKCK